MAFLPLSNLRFGINSTCQGISEHPLITKNLHQEIFKYIPSQVPQMFYVILFMSCIGKVIRGE